LRPKKKRKKKKKKENMSVDQFARIRTLLDQGKLDEAHKLVERAVQHHISDRASRRRIANCATHLSHLQAEKNDLSRALNNMQLALRLHLEASSMAQQKDDNDDDNDEDVDEGDEDELALCHYALGLLWQRKGDFDRARASFRDAMKRGEAIGRRESAQTVACLGALACLDQLQERPHDAATGFDRAIDLQVRVGVADSDAGRKAFAELLHSSGAAWFQAAAMRGRGRFEERVNACERLERAIDQRSKVKNDDKAVAELHLLIGTYLTSMGDDARGDERIKRGTTMMEAACGRESGEFASCLEALATAHQMRGQHRDAKELFERAIEIYTRTLGAAHAHVATCTHKMLVSMDRLIDEKRSQKKSKEALPLTERALALRERVHGSPSEPVAGTLVLLGTLAFEAGDIGVAKKHFQRALKMLTEVAGADSEPVGGSLFNLANCERASGNWKEAASLYSRAKAVFLALKQQDKVDFIDRIFAMSCAQCGKPAAGEFACRKCAIVRYCSEQCQFANAAAHAPKCDPNAARQQQMQQQQLQQQQQQQHQQESAEWWPFVIVVAFLSFYFAWRFY
jgi:tetratricopeptide (TPR) repeat protein